MHTMRVVRLGRLSYRRTLQLQEELFKKRKDGEIPDTILCVEHAPSVYTVGMRDVGFEDVVGTTHKGEPVEVVQVRRGGRATWHGPGQLTVYPIVNIQTLKRASAREAGPRLVTWWSRVLELSVLRFLERQRVAAWTCDDVGVWVGGPHAPLLASDAADSGFVYPVVSEEQRVVCGAGNGAQRKLAAIGVQLQRYCSMHGVAINLTPDLSVYDGLVPCGLTTEVTSLQKEAAAGGDGGSGVLSPAEAIGPFLEAFVETLQPHSSLELIEHAREHYV